jgi:hypothetical protein
MGSYNDYLSELKVIRPALDDRRLRAGIENRLARQAARKKLLLESGLALLLLVTALYFNFRPHFSGGPELVADYVYHEEPVDGPLLDYVFE